MKESGKIFKYKNGLIMSLGVIMAFTVVFTQTFYFDIVSSSKTQVEIEKQVDDADAENEDSAELTISKSVVSSVVQLNVNQVLHFISDIHFDVEEKTQIESDDFPDLNKYFKALFNLIISPNAP